MESKRRVISVILLMAILSTILGGCKFMGTTYYDSSDLTEETLEYMEEKYGNTFTVERADEGNGTWDVILRSDVNPDWWIEADYYYKDKFIVDNYATFLRQDEIEKLAQEITDNAIETETKVYFEPKGDRGTNNSSYNPDTPIEEYMRELWLGYTSVRLYINETSTEKADLYLERLCEEMKNRNVCFAYDTILVESEVFEMVSKENTDVPKLYYGSFFLDKNYEYRPVNWKEGKKK